MTRGGTEPANSLTDSLGWRMMERPKSMTLMVEPNSGFSKRMFSSFKSLRALWNKVPMDDLPLVAVLDGGEDL